MEDSLKLFFLRQFTLIFSLRFLDGLNRLWKNTEVIKRTATLNLFLAFQQSGPLVEKRCFRRSVFG